MSNKVDLQGQTIVFTGQPKSNEALLEVERLGGEVKIFPLNQTQEVTSQDEFFMTRLHSYEWLIFTSQNAVSSFSRKIESFHLDIKDINMKIAAVGIKTANAIEALGLHVSFMPTIYSADAFVEQFPKGMNSQETCLFVRGSLAKATIKEGLGQHVDEWTVYETLPDLINSRRLSTYISQHPNIFIAFASPSAVEIYARDVAPIVGWNHSKIAAIGHVTAASLKNHGIPVHVLPATYTWLALIQEIANWKEE
ncbi:MAG: uroporphyrinogen-III synthase [Paenisporosarcina sp.]